MKTNKSRIEKSVKNGSLTIGLILSNMKTEWNSLLSQGIIKAAYEYGVNIAQFPMGGLNEHRSNDNQFNIISDLAHSGNINGIIISESSFIPQNTNEEIIDFCRQFTAKPVIIANAQYTGFPSVLCTYYDLYETAIKHLVEVHGFKRITLLTNTKIRRHNQEIKVFHELAEKYQFPSDEKWSIIDAPKTNRDGRLLTTLYKLLDQNVEVIISKNKASARIVNILMDNWVKVPEDIAVISLTDQWNGQFTSPPLTVVNRNYDRIGFAAVTGILDLLAGKNIPDTMEIPVDIIRRRSCGCNQHRINSAEIINQGGIRIKKTFLDHKKDILAEIDEIRDETHIQPDFITELISAYDTELKGNNKFINTLELKMNENNIHIFAQFFWQQILSIMIKWSLPFIQTDKTLLHMQAVWQQARLLIADKYRCIQGMMIFYSQTKLDKYRQFYNTLTSTFSLEKISDLLITELQKFGIPFACLVLYENPGLYKYPYPIYKWSNLVMAYMRHGRMDLGKNSIRFQTKNILPETILADLKAISGIPLCYTIEGLISETNQIGYIILGNTGKEPEKTHWLKTSISIALQTALLFKQIQIQKNDIEGLYEKLEKENMRMTSELNIMKRLKQIVLPVEKELFVFYKYQIASYVQPSNEKNSNYFDIIKKNSNVFLGLGDISAGKLESSMILIMVQSIMRALIEKGETDLTNIFHLFNQILKENTRQFKVEYQLTLLLVKIEQKQISLTGHHENLFILTNSGKLKPLNLINNKTYTAIESFQKNNWKEIKINLKPDESIILYTNGLTMARGKYLITYSERRLHQIISSNYLKNAETIKNTVMSDFNLFTQNQVQDNDVSFAVIKAG